MVFLLGIGLVLGDVLLEIGSSRTLSSEHAQIDARPSFVATCAKRLSNGRDGFLCLVSYRMQRAVCRGDARLKNGLDGQPDVLASVFFDLHA